MRGGGAWGGRRVGGWVLGVLMAVGVAGLSRVPWNLGPDEPTSELRLSWRTRAATTEACRPPTEAEVAGLPAHMRPREICEGGAVPVQLQVSVDGTELREGLLPSARDRTVSVYEIYPVPPGDHEVLIHFGPDPGASPGAPTGGAASFRGTLRFEPGRARLITLGPDGLTADGTE